VNWLQRRYRRIFFNGCSIFGDAGWRHCGLSNETGAVWRRTLPTRRSVSTIRSPREPSGAQQRLLGEAKPRFGGVRWWFICPHSGARVGRLHLPPGSSLFAGRRAYALRYACQTETRHQRAARRASKLIARLGGRPDPYFPPDKPKRMRLCALWDRPYPDLSRESIPTIIALIDNAEVITSPTRTPIGSSQMTGSSIAGCVTTTSAVATTP
jgi:hypothetical protein